MTLTETVQGLPEGCTYESNLPKEIFIPKRDKKIEVTAYNVVDCEEEPRCLRRGSHLPRPHKELGLARQRGSIDVHVVFEVSLTRSSSRAQVIDVTDHTPGACWRSVTETVTGACATAAPTRRRSTGRWPSRLSSTTAS